MAAGTWSGIRRTDRFVHHHFYLGTGLAALAPLSEPHTRQRRHPLSVPLQRDCRKTLCPDPDSALGRSSHPGSLRKLANSRDMGYGQRRNRRDHHEKHRQGNGDAVMTPKITPSHAPPPLVVGPEGGMYSGGFRPERPCAVKRSATFSIPCQRDRVRLQPDQANVPAQCLTGGKLMDPTFPCGCREAR